jgi:hypothetical protein
MRLGTVTTTNVVSSGLAVVLSERNSPSLVAVKRKSFLLGHLTEFWPEWTWKAGAVCMIQSHLISGIQTAGADPRRPAYAVGW